MAKVHQILYFLLLFISLGSFCLTGCLVQGVPFVRYVPTPDDVVVEMLQLARVNQDDLVYDLGCGDGRFVITAAKVFGARGVGVDIDPIRIRESEENARKEGVTERVNFFVQDLFQTDIREATVVTLYLFPDLNLKLRPKLFRELRPGTRVLSYQYDMGEWKPDNRRTVRKARISPEEADPVYYYWVIPADAGGVWRWSMGTSEGDRDYFLHLAQTFQKIRGEVKVQGREAPIKEPRLAGDRLSFTFVDETQGPKVSMRFTGRLSGNSIEGGVAVQGGPDAGNYNWTAKRAP
jgi:SAM-dependent methyltransferase